jgi:hypothetical protein
LGRRSLAFAVRTVELKYSCVTTAYGDLAAKVNSGGGWLLLVR